MLALEKFSGPDTACKRCGAAPLPGEQAGATLVLTVEFCSRDCERDADGVIVRQTRADVMGAVYDPAHDHLHRKCIVCGFESLEALPDR